MATLDKRTGEIKEGIGGSSSKEAARQNRERRDMSKDSREAARQNRERRDMSKASREAAAQNKERFSGVAGSGGGAPPAGGAGMPGTSPRLQQSQERMQQARKRMQQAEKEQRDSKMAMGSAMKQKGIRGALRRGFVSRRRKRSEKDLKRAKKDLKKAQKANATEMFREFAGIMWLRFCWSWLWGSFGHTIYLINFTFFIGFMQRYIGFYLPIKIPEVGGEWTYNPMAPKSGAKKGAGKTKVMIIKVFELLFIALVTLLVLAADTLIIGMIGMLILVFASIAGAPLVGSVLNF